MMVVRAETEAATLPLGSLPGGADLAARVSAERERRVGLGQWRTVPIREAVLGRQDLCSNDYLRLSRHPEVVAGSVAAAERWGASASASPLLGGYTRLHEELLAALAAWQGYSTGLLWTTGFAANQAVLGCLPQRGDVVLADRLIHASMVAGLLKSGARICRYRHLDLGHLEALLREHSGTGRSVFVVTESVFSMDGDFPDLAALAALREHWGFIWVVDEAHGLGWYGPGNAGLLAEAGVAGQPDVLVGTLGKALGSMGAFTLFREPSWADYLVNVAGEFIYSTFLSPPAAGAALAAVKLVQSPAFLVETAAARATSRYWRRVLRERGWAVPSGDSPVVPVGLGSEVTTLARRDALGRLGWSVAAVRPPTVPAGSSRLRLSLHRELTSADGDDFAEALGHPESVGGDPRVIRTLLD